VRRKLRLWGVEGDEAARIEQLLLADGYVDNARYARAFVREKSKFAHWGAIKIKAALQSKSIAGATIAEALQEINADAQPEILEKMLRRKSQTIAAKSPQDLQAKLLRFGLSRGFAYDEVAAQIAKITKGED
jgi:regulatory protein